MRQPTEYAVVKMARRVLTERLARVNDPDLFATVVYDPQKDLIGFAMTLPASPTHEVGSRPAIEVKDATLATLRHAFDEGLTVIRNEIEKVDA